MLFLKAGGMRIMLSSRNTVFFRRWNPRTKTSSEAQLCLCARWGACSVSAACRLLFCCFIKPATDLLLEWCSLTVTLEQPLNSQIQCFVVVFLCTGFIWWGVGRGMLTLLIQVSVVLGIQFWALWGCHCLIFLFKVQYFMEVPQRNYFSFILIVNKSYTSVLIPGRTIKSLHFENLQCAV